MSGETGIGKMLEEISVEQAMAFDQTADLADATALLAAIYSSAKQSYRLHVAELGCTGEDIDRALRALDRFFFEHPESL